ncbi:MAG: TRAP transporter small permease subunit [Bacillota bacterium]|nr:TRAP transporter small permease subunit [Bacillota bacterium]
MALIEKVVRSLIWRTAQFGQLALAAVMVLIVANVFLRIRWNPVPGTVEMTEILGSMLLALGVAYCTLVKGHIFVSVLVDKFPPRIQALVDSLTTTIALFFVYALARETFIFAARMAARGYATAHLLLPVAPSIYIVAFGFAMVGVVLLLDLVKSLIKVVKGVEAG